GGCAVWIAVLGVTHETHAQHREVPTVGGNRGDCRSGAAGRVRRVAVLPRGVVGMSQTCKKPGTAKDCATCAHSPLNQLDKAAGSPINPQARKDGKCGFYVMVLDYGIRK
ncbi:MAG TPA: hypothetical protein PLY87_29570, partial [Planctomycetaceae bacterium]|nr:hypothetical protein [Planctomycetaceae bacterium]